MTKNNNLDCLIDYLVEKYSEIYKDKYLVEKYKLTIQPEEIIEQIDLFKNIKNQKSKNKRNKSNENKKKKEIRDFIKTIDSEEKLYEYYRLHLLKYYDKSRDKQESTAVLNEYSKEELKYLYSIIFKVPLKKSTKKADILWAIKSYFDNKARVDSMRL